MRYSILFFLCLFFLITVGAGANNDLEASTDTFLMNVPLVFIQNQGQYDETVSFFSVTSESELIFTSQGVHFLQYDPENDELSEVFLTFPGSSDIREVTGHNPIEGKANYFIGNDPGSWLTNLSCYEEIVYHDLYPGINLVYSGTYGHLKSEFLVAPGADPGMIMLWYEGAENVHVDESGCLIIETSSGRLMEAPLICYQESGDEVLDIPATYHVGVDGCVTLNIGPYDSSLPLVVDPEIVYSTFFGGSSTDWGKSIAVDGQGNMYITGQTYSGNLPVKSAYQSSKGAGTKSDAYITKISASGSTLVYSTFIGGSGTGVGERGYGIVIDNAGNAYITGVTDSTNFPVKSAYQSTIGTNPYSPAMDAFVTKLSPSGSSLVYSTYLGGSYDDWGYGIAVDSTGCAYVTGYTGSGGTTGKFPVKNAFQSSLGGEMDVFVTKMSADGKSLVYSTYLGGSQNERGYGIAIDSQGCAFVTGGTHSENFPTKYAYDGQYNGVCDTFVTKLAATGSSLVYSTYLGGNDDDYAYGIAVDLSGCSYVTGITLSSDFPTTNAFRSYPSGGYDGFVTKFNSAGSALAYSTYLGGNGFDYGKSLCVDASGKAYVTGHTESTNFPLVNSVQGAFGGGQCDAFVTILDAGGSSALLSTYLGGNDYDEGWGITLGPSGDPYTIGVTGSTNFFTKNAYKSQFGGERDAYIVKLNIGIAPPVGGFTSNVTSGYIPLTVRFTDQSTGSPTSWSWTFGDGGTSTQQSPVHTYTVAGTYTVTLTVINAGGSDTDKKTGYLTGTVAPPIAQFTTNVTSGTVPLSVKFTDQSAGSPSSWSWTFGDGGTSTQQSPVHTYTSAGTYTITLTVTNAGGNDSETKTGYLTGTVAPPVAQFTANVTSGIKPLSVKFTDQSTGSPTSWSWIFGDGGTSTQQSPVHTYSSTGKYTVSLTATNAGGSDAETKTQYITVNNPPSVTLVAAGDHAYDIGEEVHLSGTNTASTITYLFITGPTLPTNGVKLEDLSFAAVTGQQGTFTTTTVYSDKTWEYDWDTGALSGIPLAPGIYTIYAVSEPKNYASLATAVYSDEDVLFRGIQQLTPFPSCTAAPTDPDGDGVYEDTNGNGRKDFNDIVIFFKQMTWVSQNEPIECFDFNGNGRLDFNDVVMMFQEM